MSLYEFSFLQIPNQLRGIKQLIKYNILTNYVSILNVKYNNIFENIKKEILKWIV
jgi:hypothetical protein